VPASPATIRDVTLFQAAVLAWFGANGRNLNFRRRRDAYAVLVSEAMAQQTQISRVEPAWEAFLERFPTVQALASAPTADVLRAWQGMGYNRRALNLQRAARVVVDEHGGAFPGDVAALQRLPGVGPYTARAVAAIAFGRRVGAVDTNVRRVLGRVAGGWTAVPAAGLQALADDVVPADRAGEWTHALMDIGATFCRPRAPLCADCPVRAWCVARAAGPPPLASRRARTPGSARLPFPQTARWLRGRLVDRARGATGDGWIRIDEPVARHDRAAVAAAARALCAEGLLERHPTDPLLVRLPQ
jgi:A/G-specific adenine glycosylase